MTTRRLTVHLLVALFALSAAFGGAATLPPHGASTSNVAGPSPTTRPTHPGVSIGSAPCAPVWEVQETPSPAVTNNLLHSVVTIGPGNAWAVGSAFSQPQTVIEHWDGSTWTLVPSPNLGSANYLYGVDAASASDIWAVGAYMEPSVERHRTLIVHFDGASWVAIPSPNAGKGHNYLQAVEAISATNVWAVGYHENDSGVVESMILHYDGVMWRQVPSPNPAASGNYLYGISASAPSDVWAVGTFYDSSAGNLQTLALHYGGTAWSAVSTPNAVENSANVLMDVDAISGSDAWAVGFANGTDGFDQVILQWTGDTWSLTPPDTSSGRLFAVESVSENDVWAVGITGLFRHWDGTSWQTIVTQDSLYDGALFGISALPTGDVHVVGTGTPPRSRQEETLAGSLCEVTVTDGGFSVDAASVGLGRTAVWNFPSTNLQGHWVTAQGLRLFDSGGRAPGTSYTFTFNGAGTYRATDRVSGDGMKLEISPTAAPLQGGEGAEFTITWASAPIARIVFDVQIKRPGSSWENWMTGVTATSGTFVPDAGVGLYSFKARVRNPTNNRSTNYSPPVTITVG